MGLSLPFDSLPVKRHEKTIRSHSTHGLIPSPLNGSPLIASAIAKTAEVAQAVLRPEVKLILSADRQLKTADKITWQALDSKQANVMTGDVVRYTLSGKNNGKGAARNVALVQPIAAKTVLIPNTVVASGANSVTYSIDNGKTFTATPMVQVKGQPQPAPIASYTHLRIQLKDALAPNQAIMAQYNVQVK
ncbi:MAG: hypothetical protein HC860_09970 [Alkalinema sp. RU_4_3]|nr:hypothetical protein [Alkalinema sp. RU_4_3]